MTTKQHAEYTQLRVTSGHKIENIPQRGKACNMHMKSHSLLRTRAFSWVVTNFPETTSFNELWRGMAADVIILQNSVCETKIRVSITSHFPMKNKVIEFVCVMQKGKLRIFVIFLKGLLANSIWKGIFLSSNRFMTG